MFREVSYSNYLFCTKTIKTIYSNLCAGAAQTLTGSAPKERSGANYQECCGCEGCEGDCTAGINNTSRARLAIQPAPGDEEMQEAGGRRYLWDR